MPTTTLRPNARGSANTLVDFPSAGANWDKVDEASSDADSTYVYTTDPFGLGTSGTDLYLVPDISPLGKVISVTVYSRCRYAAVGTNTARVLLKMDGVTYEGTIETLTGSYVTYSHEFSPVGDWNEASVADMEIGVRLDTNVNFANGSVRCTQVWADVTYDYGSYKVVIGDGEKLSIGTDEKLLVPQVT